MALQEYSVRLRTADDYHFIVPVRAGSPEHAEGYARRFIADFYKVTVADCIVRYRGCALPTWCRPARRVDPVAEEVRAARPRSRSRARAAA